MRLASLFLALALLGASSPVVIVPIDDRPVTRQLPVLLGRVAGIPIVEPPRALLGTYLDPGKPDAIYRWLVSDATAGADAFVLSSDMLAYGGLVASRAPGIDAELGYARLRYATALRGLRTGAAFYGFGTVMRLAPTGIPALGPAASFFAAGDDVDLLTEYANLADPPTGNGLARAEALRGELGDVLVRYLDTRRRDLNVDLFALQLTAEGGFDRFVLGQDDAGPQGLHLRDLAALRAARDGWGWGLKDRTSVEPGADELAMILEAAAFARRARWEPTVTVTWSRPDGGTLNDPLEFAPLENTVDSVIRACTAQRVAAGGAVQLFIKVKETNAEQERAFLDGIAQAISAGALVAVVDLTFLGGSAEEQRALVEAMIARRLAGRVAGFGSWNTAANSVGTALPAAIAVGAGKRLGSFDPTALAELLLDRYADDYAFHDFVRPALNQQLDARGVDHSYLLPEVAKEIESRNRSLLWPRALELLSAIFPGYRDAGMTITLPWGRTFETELDVRLRRER
ncbi:MAG: DUF4127 family protein [Candidatus Eremiobacteraeota bacterium]|nr:DUF4127 family protein [Candidatus Eremiobacteraeota bacterium]